MRKGAILVLAAAVMAPGVAGAQTTEDRLDEAREAQGTAQAAAQAAQADLASLGRRYARVQARANAAAARLIDAYLRETTLQAQVAEAQSILNDRADAVYRAGPGALIEPLISSSSWSEFLARHELIEHTLLADVGVALDALDAGVEAAELRRELEREQEVLTRHQRELAEIREAMEARLGEAREAALAAGVRIQSLLDQQRELAQAAVVEQEFGELVQASGELARLLEMLGPAGGRGCTIPEALASTGQTFAGEASFYGEEFAGNPTAIGHIFNPALFTAAHRTLPLPSFLLVRYGERCATVLVNDRGPYVDGRILDLSEGAARYIGLPGVGQVHAEILEPE